MENVVGNSCFEKSLIPNQFDEKLLTTTTSCCLCFPFPSQIRGHAAENKQKQKTKTRKKDTTCCSKTCAFPHKAITTTVNLYCCTSALKLEA